MNKMNTSIQTLPKADTHKIAMLILCLFLDLIGMLSYLLPVLGEVVDIVWAPISAVLIYVLFRKHNGALRSEEHTSELQSRGLISYAVFCLKKKNTKNKTKNNYRTQR